MLSRQYLHWWYAVCFATFTRDGRVLRMWLVVGGLLATSTLGAALAEVPSRLSLLIRAARVGLPFEPPDNWQLRGLNGGAPTVATLNDTDWLVGLLNSKTIKYTISAMDLRTRHSIVNSQLTSIFNRNGVLVRDIEPSPDGRWVLGTVVTNVFTAKTWWRIAAAIDGSRYWRWSANIPWRRYAAVPRGVNASHIAWSPDSRKVAEIVADEYPFGQLRLLGVLRDVYSGRFVKIGFSSPALPLAGYQLAIRPGVLLVSSRSNYQEGWAWPLGQMMREDPDSIVHKDYASVDVYSWPLRESPGNPQITHLGTPPGTWLVGLAFSPNGRRLAWEVVREHRRSIGKGVQSSLSSASKLPQSEQIEVWTSNLDGTDMKMVGHLPVKEKWNTRMRLRLTWLPSGKQLRFVFEDAFYVVRAN